MKITRRKLAIALAAPTVAAQTPALSADPLESAKARVKANSEALAKEHVPISTEPAFQFKA